MARHRLAACVFAVLAAASAGAQAPPSAPPEGPAIVMTADEVSYDRELDVVTARGHVEVSHEGRILIADSLTYSRRQDLLTASGNIALIEPTGETLFAQYLELTGDFRDGILEDLRMILKDGARIAANGARRSSGDILEMRQAVYSPCELCRDDPMRAPLWQVKAVKVVHDANRKTVEYSDAWLELAGVPVVYTPYLSHPDPTVRRRTGFLAPQGGGSSSLGAVVQVPYFIEIDPQSDLTVTPIYTSKEGPVLSGEYRQRFLRGRFEGSGSVTQDSKNDVRGHLFGEGRFDLDDTWRGGFDLKRTTDDTYLRRYGFGREPVLTSRAFAEGFRQRNYMAFNAYSFQGLRPTDRNGLTPYVLPMFDFNHLSEADRFGGRRTLDANLVALSRTNGHDTRRAALAGGWNLPYVGPLGDMYTLSATLEGDLYHVSDLDRPGRPAQFTGTSGRVWPQLALDWRYPFVRDEGTIYQMVEPIASFVVAPYGGNPSAIPNEDSLDFEFDDTNLFRKNRFTGIDRVESGPRVNYGLKWGVFGEGGGSTTVLFGQSYRLREDRNFQEGSGLEDHFSDYVGRVRVSPTSKLDLLYRARWDKDDLGMRRSELDLSGGPDALRAGVNYLFFDRQRESEFDAREQLSVALSALLGRNWRTQFAGIWDLREDRGGLRTVGLGFIYEDECFIFATTASRNFYEDRDLKPSDAIMFRLVFKTLGDVETSVR